MDCSTYCTAVEIVPCDPCGQGQPSPSPSHIRSSSPSPPPPPYAATSSINRAPPAACILPSPSLQRSAYRQSPMAFIPSLPLARGRLKPCTPLVRPPFQAPRTSRHPPAANFSTARDATPTQVCPQCADRKTLPCTLCNTFGFLEVNEATVWRTCHICKAQGNIPCPACSPPPKDNSQKPQIAPANQQQ
ncbi:unnamed protein product [Chondrus crispus]|uniref:Uncharacterized protein n=1 Tax=Chondrus crispus TaxID=2769 RepID=R7Q849_CHOCR|nr:unnamed protein product [Chondrus crispus]CDF34214.1 unnamed protein product [Chondrus crispus]|eukprot:XP_005714033.1 unnamed protein product [Chondrus crispus]